MNSGVVLNFDSAQDLLCSYCHEEFKTNENRRYQILIDNNKITTLSAIHINLCLPRAEEEAALAKIEAVHLPGRHWVKSFQELETKFPFIAKLVDAYEGAAIYTSTGTGYVLEFPISLGNVPIVKELFKFQQFKAFFTAVQIKEIALDGVRALDYPAQLKKSLQMLLQPLIGCTMFVWIHQVTGTNNCFRIILAIQANESDLVSVYQSSLFQVWTNTVIDSNHRLVQTLTDPVGKALGVFEEKLESTAKALQLKPAIKSVKNLDVSHTGIFNGVYHHEYNVQQCQGEMYVLPRLENIVSDAKTPVLCFSGNSSEYLPIFYDTTVTDIEKELIQAKLTKQPLTNYQSLLALFPQAINRPT